MQYLIAIVCCLRLDSPICDNQLATWHTLFLGYVGLASIISSVIVIIMGYTKSSSEDYRRESLISSYTERIRKLIFVLLSTYVFVALLLTIHACYPLPIIGIILSVLAMIPTIYYIITYTNDIRGARTDSKKFVDKVKTRLKGILQKDAAFIRREDVRAEDLEYPEEIWYVFSIIQEDIVNHYSSHAEDAFCWLQEIVLGLIPEALSVSEINDLGKTTCAARDSLAKLIIEASDSGNRGLLNSVLIQTELSSQHFIKAGLSTTFHSLLDAYQLAMKEQPDNAIIEQYTSCFDAFGNLIAAISVLEDNSERLKFKLAVLNTTLVLICNSFSIPEVSSSIIHLVEILLRLDEDLPCSNEGEEKDQTGLGCWFFVNTVFLHISLSASESESELHRQASTLYANMLHRINESEFPFQNSPKAVRDLEKHWETIKSSSTGSSLGFCLREYYPRFNERMLRTYLLEAVFIVSLTYLQGNSLERYRIVKEILDMYKAPPYSKGDLRELAKRATDAELISMTDDDVLSMVEDYIRKMRKD